MFRTLGILLFGTTVALAEPPNIQQYIDSAWSQLETQKNAEIQTLVTERDALAAKVAEQQDLLDSKGPLFWYDWDETHAGEPLDLTGYVETFRDDFDSLATIGRKDAAPGVKWYTGARTNFGNVAFMQIGDYYSPYEIVNGALRITMNKLSATTTPPLPSGTNQYKSGLIMSVNANGVGFAQSMGYFEARIQMPVGVAPGYKVLGAWPGWWLLSNNEHVGPVGSIMEEFDINEAYGSDPRGLHSTIHYKPPFTNLTGEWPSRQTKSNYVDLSKVTYPGTTDLIWGLEHGNMFNGDWHTYGVLIDDDFYRVYVDNFEVARYKTLPWMKTPLYMLLNLALYGPEASSATFPQYMHVDRVVVMKKAN